MGYASSIKYFIPEVSLAATALLIIILSMISLRNQSRILYLTIWFGMILSLIFLIIFWNESPHGLFFNSIAADPFGRYFKLLLLIVTFIIVLISQMDNGHSKQPGVEYYFLIIVMLLGMFLMVSANDLLVIYLSIEITNVCSFVLIGYSRSRKILSRAALRYLVSGLLLSCLMIFGLSLLYGIAGSLSLPVIGAALFSSDVNRFSLTVILLLILSGLAFKISIVPFHFSNTDVNNRASKIVTAYFIVAPKVAGFALLIRFFYIAFTSGYLSGNAVWTAAAGLPWNMIFGIFAAITMTVGNLAALRQTNVGRMLVYSSIAHTGYILLGLVTLNREGLIAAIFYLTIYSFITLGVYLCMIAISNKTGNEEVFDYKGIGYRSPFVVIPLLIFISALIGLPPTVGFAGKFYLFSVLIKGGSTYYWLVVISILNCILSSYYYAKLINVMFLRKAEKIYENHSSVLMRTLILFSALLTIIFGLYWIPLTDFINESLYFFIP